MNEAKVKGTIWLYAVVGVCGGLFGGPAGAIVFLLAALVIHLWCDHFAATVRFLGKALKWAALVVCSPVVVPYYLIRGGCKVVSESEKQKRYRLALEDSRRRREEEAIRQAELNRPKTKAELYREIMEELRQELEMVESLDLPDDERAEIGERIQMKYMARIEELLA